MISALPIHGGQLRHLAAHFGIPAHDLLDFSANINPAGPPPGVLSALRASLGDLSTLTSYPDSEEIELRQSIARYVDLDVINIAVANGFVPLLEAALRALPIRSCLLPVPAFVEYRKALARAKIKVNPHILTPESNFNYNVEAMIADRQDTILLANPQNPSGVCCSQEMLLDLVSRAAERNSYVLLDEAFIDYQPEHSLAAYVHRLPNLIVFRSVTKFHGIPGLRVAYATANPILAKSIQVNLPPWPISTLASRAVSGALEDEVYANCTRLLNRQRRIYLQTELEALGIHTYPSAANFLFLRLPANIDPYAFWRRMLVEHHIVLRSCSNYEALPAGYLRAAIRTEQENTRFVQAASFVLQTFSKR